MSRGPMIVDFHIHIFPPEIVAQRDAFGERDPFFGTLYANPRTRLATAEDAIAAMDRDGVDLAVALGWGWSDPALCAAHNDYLADVVRRYPTRFAAFAAVNPLQGESAAAEVERSAGLGLRGVGELMPHGQDWSLDDERAIGPVAEAALALNLVLLTHASEPVGHEYPGKGNVHPPALLRFLRRWPSLRVVLAHWGGGLPFYELMPEVAELTRNVYYDSAATPFLYRSDVFAVATRCVGPHRILYGSDYPLIRQASLIRKVRDCGLESDEVAAVLGENARRLLAVTGDPAASARSDAEDDSQGARAIE